MVAALHVRPFGRLPSGETVEAYVLRGSGGVELEAIPYGGIVTRLLAPGREGARADVVLGFSDLDAYLTGNPFFGAVAGRVAGRITGARFVLDGKAYPLAANDPPNHLHGGVQGLDKRLWRAARVSRGDGAPSVRFSYRSPDGEGGYPGTVDIAVTYTVTADNAFLIETEATTDRATPLSLTHHSYFNLAGEGAETIDDHELQVNAGEAIACDESMTLLGRVFSIDGMAADFTRPRRLGDAIPSLFQRHGDLYRLRRPSSQDTGRAMISAARLVHPASGRVLEVRTTEAFLQVYTGAALDGTLAGKSGRPYGPHAGLCLECENYPDGANLPTLGDIILRPGTTLRHATAYAFSTI